MGVRAISFDADQTLWDFRSVQQRALDTTARTMIDRGLVPAGSVDATRLQSARDEIVADVQTQPHNLEEVRRASFALVLERAGCMDVDARADELLAGFLDVRFGEIELYPEVRGCLDRLRAQHRLGLLSNGNSYPDRCGLGGVFDAVVFGPSHGFAKPDPRAFATIAAQLGVEATHMMHVGDDWDDVHGANAAGMVSVYLNREGADPPFRQHAAVEIGNLEELEL
ncbi:MAG: HAD family hydrolase, partial [Actinomycetota bacterium]